MLVDLVAQLIDFSGLFQIILSARCQGDRSHRAVEERDAVKLLLNLLDRSAEGRLGDIKILRRL